MVERANTTFEVVKTVRANALLAAGVTALYTLHGMIYNLNLSPISSFLGLGLAALTMWYEFYYGVSPGYSQYTFHTRNLHATYGPIIRINPYKL
jgi:hypothetical protein